MGACSQVQPREAQVVETTPSTASAPQATNSPEADSAIPPYLMPILTPLRDFLHTLNIAAIGGILVLYLALLVALLSKRR
jgi:hypothetical protein